MGRRKKGVHTWNDELINGYKTGTITLIERLNNRNHNKTKLLCKCSCGKELFVLPRVLIHGKQSCGCLPNKRNSIHMEASIKTPEYLTWISIKQRCYDKNHKSSEAYKKNNIKVCERWLKSYNDFLSDMGRKPTIKHTLDRINSKGNYEPSNCRWATRTEQNRNKKNCVYLEYSGQKRNASEWDEILGFPETTVLRRLRAGWCIDRILTTAVKTPNRKQKLSTNK